MRALYTGAAFVMAALLCLPARADEPIRMAITIDDLPAAGTPVPGWSEARILTMITSALHAHHVPEAVGFLCGGNMDQAPETQAALRAWLNGGFVLGNHTYSHSSADRVSVSRFEADIARDQAVIAELAPHSASTYFRYPYLERGRTQDDWSIRRYLAHHDYRTADVSVDFEDWAFSAAYGRCSARRDDAALALLRESYLDYALRELASSRDTLRRVAGRPVPQVLLLHANFLTAQLLDRLLTEYERAGVQFVSLREVLEDGIYAQAQKAHHGDGGLLEALVRERRTSARGLVELPRGMLDHLCAGGPVQRALTAP